MSDLVVNDELKKSIDNAVNSSDIRETVIAEAIKQGFTPEAVAQATADKVAADTAAAAAARVAAVTSEPKIYTRTVEISGRSFTFDAESELELERTVNNAYTVATAFQNAQQVPETEHVPDAAQLAAERAAADKLVSDRAELELQFKRGDINAKQYLEQSGAIKDYLEEQGVPLSELKSAIQENRGRGFEQSWSDATQEFLNSAAGADWPGGERNKEILGMTIAGLGLVDADNKLAAITQAYESMKASKTVFPYEAEGTAAPVVAAVAAPVVAAVAAPVVAAVVEPVRTAPTSSSMFGKNSGPAPTAVSPAASGAMNAAIDIPADASPAQILAAYKESLIANHIDPNAAFIERFATKR